MAIAQKLAGYTLGQADLLRRAMGKKKKEELDKQFETFSAGMQERGYSMAAVKTPLDLKPAGKDGISKFLAAGPNQRAEAGWQSDLIQHRGRYVKRLHDGIIIGAGNGIRQD